MFCRIVFALSLGIIFTVWRMPHDPFFQQLVTDKFVEIFNNAFECHLTFKQVEINVWNPALIFENILVTPVHGTGWKWAAKKYSIHCSWWHIWHKRALDLDMRFENFCGESNYKDSQLLIVPHIKKIVLGKPLIPVVIEQLELSNAAFKIYSENERYAFLNWNLCAHEQQGNLHVALKLLDGAVSTGIGEITNLHAECKAEIAPNGQEPGFIMNAQCVSGDSQIYSITASLLCGQGNLDISGTDTTAIRASIDTQKQTGDFDYHVPLATITSCITKIGYHLPEIAGDFKGNGTFCYASELEIQSNYQCASNYNSHNYILDGNIAVNADSITGKGAYADFSYDILFDRKKGYLKEAQLFCKNIPFVGVHGGENDRQNYTLNADLEAVSALCTQLCNVSFDAKGQLQCQVQLQKDICHIDIATKQLFFLIPNTFYTINGFKTGLDINFAERKILINSASIAFEQGSLICNHGIVQLDSAHDIAKLHLPLQIKKVPIKLDPSIHGLATGQLAINKNQSKPVRIQGHILVADGCLEILECAHLFKNDNTQQMPFDIDCDVTFATQTPVVIQAPVVEGNIVAQLHVINNLKDPHLLGTVSLQKGIVHLPYKPLYIEKAELIFNLGSQIPLINLLATSKIKQYELMVQMVGPLDNYQFILSSSPYLEQHEIVALLLSGNPKSSPATLLPTVTCQTGLGYLKYAHKNSWLTFLDRVRLIPHFDDQSARGGIRAAFEIMVTEQLTALIQKNFSLTEDTLWQLEYAISDDIAVRATRDERRDLNAEVHMRWKF